MKIEIEHNCLAHHCEKCDTELYPDQWGASLLMSCVMVFFIGLMMFLSWTTDKSLLEPRCWAKDDLTGTGFIGDIATSAIKQFPMDCDKFTIK